MHFQDTDFDELDFADELLNAIERDYGRSIYRIPKFARVHRNSFRITVIFTDYVILEADINIIPMHDMPTIQIQGVYY